MEVNSFDMPLSRPAAIGFSCLPQSHTRFRLLTHMRKTAASFLLYSFVLMSFVPTIAATREIEIDRAREVVLAVAGFDHITVDDRSIVLNSMDTRGPAGFIPGYFSFSIIRESDTASSPDETIRMYAVSKKTGDTWEINLCTHYAFARLQKLRTAIMQETGATSEDDLESSKAVGCSSQAQMKVPSGRP